MIYNTAIIDLENSPWGEDDADISGLRGRKGQVESWRRFYQRFGIETLAELKELEAYAHTHGLADTVPISDTELEARNAAHR